MAKLNFILNYILKNKVSISIACSLIPHKKTRKELRKKTIYITSPLKKALNNIETIPNVETPINTINAIIKNKKSITRFGDGELLLTQGVSIPFQEYSEELSSRIKDIIKCNDENILVGINQLYFNTEDIYQDHIKLFQNNWVAKNLEKQCSILDVNKQYYDAAFSQPYLTLNSSYDFDLHYKSIKKIWDKRDIALISGEGILDNLDYNIFDNSNSIELINAPSKNAFNKYNQILENAKSINQDKLIIIILGPTASILAYDLAKLGYQALDLGHTAKDYDWYMKQLKTSEESSKKFFAPD